MYVLFLSPVGCLWFVIALFALARLPAGAREAIGTRGRLTPSDDADPPNDDAADDLASSNGRRLMAMVGVAGVAYGLYECRDRKSVV